MLHTISFPIFTPLFFRRYFATTVLPACNFFAVSRTNLSIFDGYVAHVFLPLCWRIGISPVSRYSATICCTHLCDILNFFATKLVCCSYFTTFNAILRTSFCVRGMSECQLHIKKRWRNFWRIIQFINSIPEKRYSKTGEP